MSTTLMKKTYEIKDDQLSTDFLISHYKSQILHKTRTAGNYTELQLKFRNLQTEMNKISNENLKLKFALSQLKETSVVDKNELMKLNEDLIKQIKEKDMINRQLYNDNRILNYEIEKKITENNKLQDELINQKNFLKQLNNDKSIVEEKLLNLNKLNQNNQNDLSNLNFQINKLNLKTNDQKNILLNKENENSILVSEIKNEKSINNDLYNELNHKDNELRTSKQKLNIANDDLNKLENNYDKLKGLHSKNSNDINVLNTECTNEKTRKEEMEGSNKILENSILEKEEILTKEKEDNITLNKDIKELQSDTNYLLKKLEGYKTHIFIMSDANKNLVKELEYVLIRDKELESTLVRDDILENMKEQNKNIVLNSRKNVNDIMNKNNDNISNINNNSNPTKPKENENEESELNHINEINNKDKNEDNNIIQENENNNEEIINYENIEQIENNNKEN